MPTLTELFPFLENSIFFTLWKVVVLSFIGVSWLAMIVYVAKDSEKRLEKDSYKFFATLLPLFLYVVGFFLYLIIRPGTTITERIHRMYLAEHFADDSCTRCQKPVAQDARFCPHCSMEILITCGQCRYMVRKTWQYCPNCQARLRSL